MTVAMLLSCDSFESFFGHVLKMDRDRYMNTYRNDWSWYYARGLLKHGIRPILYVPSLYETGLHQTDTGVAIRFLKLADWYKPLAKLRRACRATRWSLYLQERVNAMAFMRPMKTALDEDTAKLLYVQEYWGGRFDHVVHRAGVPVSGVDQGGVANGVVHTFRRSAFRKAAVLYGQTEGECRIVDSFGGHSSLQPNGCDTGIFYPDPSVPRTKTILTVARLTDKQKRTSDLIRALPQMADDWTLDIVGTGPDRDALEALAVSQGVRDRVRFHGFKSQPEVVDFLRCCGVYAMPSTNEGVSLALLEAMGCGASVVATRIRAFEPLVDDGVNGRLVPVGDPNTLALAIEDAWQNRAAFGRAAVEKIDAQYNTQKLYRRLAASMRQSIGLAEREPSPRAAGVTA